MTALQHHREQAGIAIILLMSALSIFTLASYASLPRTDTSSRAGIPMRTGITMDDARFTGIRAMLPQSGTVGYLSDTTGNAESDRSYYLTQYYLAPIVVARDTTLLLQLWPGAVFVAFLACRVPHRASVKQPSIPGSARLFPGSGDADRCGIC
jgi:hypothetical protein